MHPAKKIWYKSKMLPILIASIPLLSTSNVPVKLPLKVSEKFPLFSVCNQASAISQMGQQILMEEKPKLLVELEILGISFIILTLVLFLLARKESDKKAAQL